MAIIHQDIKLIHKPVNQEGLFHLLLKANISFHQSLSTSYVSQKAPHLLDNNQQGICEQAMIYQIMSHQQGPAKYHERQWQCYNWTEESKPRENEEVSSTKERLEGG